MTRTAAGEAIGISQSKARALENRALQTLRGRIERNTGDTMRSIFLLHRFHILA